MGAVTNRAVTARGRALQRAAAGLAGRAERDARINAAAARVTAAQDCIRANAERRALAVAAADRAERDANAAADEQILEAVRELRADAMSVAGIAELLQLPVPRVRQLIKHTNAGGDAEPPAPETSAAHGGAG